MVNDLLRRGVWRMRRWARPLVVVPLLALALAIGTGAFHVWVTMPMQADLEALKAELDAHRQRSAARRAEAAARDPGPQLEGFYGFLPGPESAAEVLGRIHEAASTENIILTQGDYRLAGSSGASMARYDIDIPVKGAYPRVRRFLAAVLRENPSVALRAVHFARPSIADSAVEAQLSMTLYLRETAE